SLIKRVNAQMALRSGVIEALVELVDEEPPTPLVDAEIERRLHDLDHRLHEQRATIQQYLEATGQTGQELVDSLRPSAEQSVKADLALRAGAEAEAIEATDDDGDEQIERLGAPGKTKPAQQPKQHKQADQTDTQ